MEIKKWEPLLRGDQAQLHFIINTLENRAFDNTNSLLNSGNTGTALLLYYYWLHSRDDRYLERGNSFIMRNFELFGEYHSEIHSLCNGTAGFRWVVNHLISNGFIEGDSNELFSEDDALLYSSMIRDINDGQYDFLHNAIGVGLYFLNRNNKQSLTYVEALISGLDKIAEADKYGIKWRSLFSISETEGKNVYNLSLSHGMASIILFLCKAYKNKIATKKSKKLICGAVSFILSHKLDNPASDYSSFFPSVVFANDNQPVGGSRLAWCYGDLGIGFALWQAAKTMHNNEWEKVALDVLLHSAARKDPVKERVTDAGICHGAAGIAHIYNRMYQYTGIQTFKETAIFWLQDTLDKAVFPDGLAGYKAWHVPQKGGWQPRSGLLEGVSGIGLVLLSAMSDVEPKWDECLLLS